MSSFITPVHSNNDDVIWIKIDRKIFGDRNDTYLGTCYLSPNGNKDITVKIFEKLGEEICRYQQKGRTILQGDFNARTSREVDFIAPDKYDLESTSQCEEETGPFGLSSEVGYLPNRNSEDT